MSLRHCSKIGNLIRTWDAHEYNKDLPENLVG